LPKNQDIEFLIIERCKDGDKKSQDMIYQQYSHAMYNTALRIVKDTQEAEDIMQEAFLDAFRKLSQFEAKASFGAWLKRIVVNKSLDSIRQHLNFEDIDEIEEPAQSTPSYFEQEHTDYKVEEIKKSLNQLSNKDRIILLLYLFEGYDHGEIGQILEISHGTARTRYSRARKNLLRTINQNRTLQSFLS